MVKLTLHLLRLHSLAHRLHLLLLLIVPMRHVGVVLLLHLSVWHLAEVPIEIVGLRVQHGRVDEGVSGLLVAGLVVCELHQIGILTLGQSRTSRVESIE